MLIRDKVKWAADNTWIPLFIDDIVFRYPGLKGGRCWKKEHHKMLLLAVLKHGYRRWQAIVDDEELRFQELICQELNLPVINLIIQGQSSSQGINSPSTSNTEPSGTPSTGNRNGSNSAAPADGAPGSSKAAANPGQ
ncbi:hypothetical protein CDL15_Pgr015128 [Punica granatum]|uniref:CHD subfamily II SANT-like domain-containing protein n=1 Tax=Punica granatum TaxID=22663 RepID=A0A218VYS1_PUNGR|nr:hypothetical protein CDL15_Pgr015128 [Punica granatum]